jgi:hypothetical protein
MAVRRMYQPRRHQGPRQFNYSFLHHEQKEIESHYNFVKCKIITPNKRKRLLEVIGTYDQTGVAYIYKILYDGYSAPTVRILSPTLMLDSPHIYKNGNLCLYYPKEQPWSNKTCKLFSHTIPWIHEWILFYEIWKISGVWEHPEVNHEIIKK